MYCVNCQGEAEDTFTVNLSNGDWVDGVPLCAYCYGLTDTQR